MVKWTEIASGDLAGIGALAKEYQIHPLAIEDCIHRNQRPKLEDFGTHQFLVWFLMIRGEICEVQFIIFSDQIIIVPHDRPPEGENWYQFFRLEDHQKDAWHMIYHALDRATDVTWNEVRTVFGKIDDFEQRMFKEDCDPQFLMQIKKQLNQIDYSIGLLASVAEQVRNFCHAKGDLNWKLRDLHDHCERIDRSLSLYRAQIGTTIELFWGHQANRTNRHIKKLTLIASISVPLTVWSSFWGMNFEVIPFKSGALFLFAMAIMLLSVGGTFAVLVRKGYWND
jgi:magnesium transporter